MLSRTFRRSLPVLKRQLTRPVHVAATDDVFGVTMELDEAGKVAQYQFTMFGCGPQNTSFAGNEWLYGKTLEEIKAEVLIRDASKRLQAEKHSYRVLLKAIETHQESN